MSGTINLEFAVDHMGFEYVVCDYSGLIHRQYTFADYLTDLEIVVLEHRELIQ